MGVRRCFHGRTREDVGEEFGRRIFTTRPERKLYFWGIRGRLEGSGLPKRDGEAIDNLGLSGGDLNGLRSLMGEPRGGPGGGVGRRKRQVEWSVIRWTGNWSG